jgi:Helix-turn-helix domain
MTYEYTMSDNQHKPDSQSAWVIVPPNVLADTRLSAGEKIVYGRVFGFIQKHGYCVASNDYLGKPLGMSKNTIRNYLSHLYALGYLRYEVLRDEHGEVQERRIYPVLIPNAVLPLVPDDVLPHTTPHTAGGTKERKDKKENNTNVNEIEKRGEKKDGDSMISLGDISTTFDIEKYRYPQKTDTKRMTEDTAKREYYAQTMAQELNDQKSVGAFRVIAEQVPENVIFQALASVKETARDGKIKHSRGALFMTIIHQWCAAHGKSFHYRTERLG